MFYFGACAGCVWKTVDGGSYWRCVSDGFLGSAAIGALAVAPSDPNVIYVGTGETEIRLDVSCARPRIPTGIWNHSLNAKGNFRFERTIVAQ